jgi:hypothetical protein
LQIVPLTTSLPTPVYVALEYAKRGRNLYNAGSRIGRPNMSVDPGYLNDHLTYAEREEREKRVNA